jgi:hypothetical protein
MFANVMGLIFVFGVLGVLIALFLIAGELREANRLKEVELRRQGISEKEIEGK